MTTADYTQPPLQIKPPAATNIWNVTTPSCYRFHIKYDVCGLPKIYYKVGDCLACISAVDYIKHNGEIAEQWLPT